MIFVANLNKENISTGRKITMAVKKTKKKEAKPKPKVEAPKKQPKPDQVSLLAGALQPFANLEAARRRTNRTVETNVNPEDVLRAKEVLKLIEG
jgi:hypothetical protein